MWSGRKGEERRECILNSTPLESFLFLYLILRKIRGEERRDFFLTSIPPRILFCFLYFLFEKSEK